MELVLHIDGEVKSDAFPGILHHLGEGITVASVTDATVTLVVNEDLTIKQHLAAVKLFLGDGWYVGTTPRPSAVSEPKKGKQVWDSVFVKPDPVVDVDSWCFTEESDKYVYLPNSLKKSLDGSEAHVANAYYTEILTNAYRRMCEAEAITPVAKLVSGVLLNCWLVQPHQGSQHTVVGGRSARLANSKLTDFDDSRYAEAFIDAIKGLPKSEFESEDVRRRVLAKVECILTGYTKHTYNQRFIQRFFEKVPEETNDQAMAIFQAMVSDGLILEDSSKDFANRLIRWGISTYKAEELVKVYQSCLMPEELHG